MADPGSLDRLTCSLLCAEEQAWSRGDYHGLIESTESPESGLMDHSMAQALFRQGSTTQYIHRYFSNFEQHRCCLRLTTGQSAYSSLRVVSNNAAEQNVLTASDNGSVEFPQSRAYHREGTWLSEEEFALFQKALLCAQFPILSAPSPPAASPSPSSQGPLGSRSPLAGHLGSRSSLTGQGRLGSGSSGSSRRKSLFDSEADEAAIPSEMICQLVAKAFQLSPEAAVHYDNVIYEAHQKKSKDKILFHELSSQLEQVESHSDPFYKPTAFVWNRQGYAAWKTSCVTLLGEKMVRLRGGGASISPGRKQAQTGDHHSDYTALLLKLISYEQGELADSTTGTSHLYFPLSSVSSRLLKEFRLRYGVGVLYCALSLLGYLSEHWEPEIWYIDRVAEQLDTITNLLPSNRSAAVMVTQELEMLERNLTLLFNHCKNALSRINRLFHRSSPLRGVAAIIGVLKQVQTLRCYIGSAETANVEDILQSFTEAEVETSYESLVLKAAVELNLDLTNNRPTPPLVNKVRTAIREEVDDCWRKFQPIYAKYFDLCKTTAQLYYKLLMEDVKVMSVKQAEERESGVRTGKDVMMLSLAYRLHQLDKEWTGYIQQSMQTWRECFLPELVHLVVNVGTDATILLKQLIAADNFCALTVPPYSVVETERREPRSDSTVSQLSLAPSYHSAFSVVQPHQERQYSDSSIETSGYVTQLTYQSDPSQSTNQNEALTSSLANQKGACPSQPTNQNGATNAEAMSQEDHEQNSNQFKKSDQRHLYKHSSSKDTAKTEHMDTEQKKVLKKQGDTEEILSYTTVPQKQSRSTMSSPGPVETTSKGMLDASRLFSGSVDELLKLKESRIDLQDSLSIEEPNLQEPKTDAGARNTDISAQKDVVIEYSTNNDVNKSEEVNKTENVNKSEDVSKHEDLSPDDKQVGPDDSEDHKKNEEDEIVEEDKDDNEEKEAKEDGQKEGSEEDLTPTSSPYPNMAVFHTSVRSGSSEHHQALVSHRPTEGAFDRLTQNSNSVLSPNNTSKYKPTDMDKPSSQNAQAKDFSSSYQNGTAGTSHRGQNGTRNRNSSSKTPHQNEDLRKTLLESSMRSTTPRTGMQNMNGGDETNSRNMNSTISGSFIDLLSLLQRYQHFVQTICQIVYPWKPCRATLKSRSRSRSRSKSVVLDDGNLESEVRNQNRKSKVVLQGYSEQKDAKNETHEYANEDEFNDVFEQENETENETKNTRDNTTEWTEKERKFHKEDLTEQARNGQKSRLNGEEQGWAASDQMKIYAKGRRTIYKEATKVVCGLIRQYVDNLLCIDMCGCYYNTALMLVGKKLITECNEQHRRQLIWGCRHMISQSSKSCDHYTRPDRKKGKFVAENHEPIVQEMCLRANLLVAVVQLLLRQHEDLDHSLDITAVNQLGDTQENNQDEQTKTGPKTEGQTERGPGMEEQRERGPGTETDLNPWRECEDHLAAVLKALLNLMAHRMSLFMGEALRMLLGLDLPAYVSVDRRLSSVHKFLTNHSRALKQWLLPENYTRVMRKLWTCVVKSFEDEVLRLQELSTRQLDKHAPLLMLTLQYLMRIFHDTAEVSVSVLSHVSENAVLWLRLYLLPPKHLLQLKLQLQQDSNESSNTTLTSSGHEPEPSELLIADYVRRMRAHLHRYRKCFTARDLISWVVAHPPTGCNTDNTDNLTAYAEKLGQKLLDNATICDLDHDLLASRSQTTTTTTSTSTSTPRRRSEHNPYPPVMCHSVSATAGAFLDYDSSDSITSAQGLSFKQWKKKLVGEKGEGTNGNVRVESEEEENMVEDLKDKSSQGSMVGENEGQVANGNGNGTQVNIVQDSRDKSSQDRQSQEKMSTGRISTNRMEDSPIDGIDGDREDGDHASPKEGHISPEEVLQSLPADGLQTSPVDIQFSPRDGRYSSQDSLQTSSKYDLLRTSPKDDLPTSPEDHYHSSLEDSFQALREGDFKPKRKVYKPPGMIKSHSLPAYPTTLSFHEMSAHLSRQQPMIDSPTTVSNTTGGVYSAFGERVNAFYCFSSIIDKKVKGRRKSGVRNNSNQLGEGQGDQGQGNQGQGEKCQGQSQGYQGRSQGIQGESQRNQNQMNQENQVDPHNTASNSRHAQTAEFATRGSVDSATEFAPRVRGDALVEECMEHSVPVELVDAVLQARGVTIPGTDGAEDDMTRADISLLAMM